MNFTISYYNERVKQQVMLLPPGILADYIHLTDLMQSHGAHLQMPHSRAMGGGLFELRPKGKERHRAGVLLHTSWTGYCYFA